MTAVAEGHQGEAGNAHSSVRDILAQGICELPESESRPSVTKGAWRVEVQVAERSVIRSICYRGKPWHPDGVV
jgi:hypothetical protein